ncbi:hypothetical protein D3C87_2001150 [compost metagenome]
MNWADTSRASASRLVGRPARYSAPEFWIEISTGGLGGTSTFRAGGMSSLIEVVAIGTATMKMISSTSRMSTNGVTLMSAFCLIA